MRHTACTVFMPIALQEADIQVMYCAAYTQRHEFMFAAQVETFTAKLLTSSNNGDTWEPVHIPNNDPQFRFTIVDARWLLHPHVQPFSRFQESVLSMCPPTVGQTKKMVFCR